MYNRNESLPGLPPNHGHKGIQGKSGNFMLNQGKSGEDEKFSKNKKNQGSVKFSCCFIS